MWLSRKNFILRSGHADGADSAFERGSIKAGGEVEIYVPWAGFNGSHSTYILKEDDGAYEIAEKFHPYYSKLSQGAKKLQARNSYQVLGHDLNTPSAFVLCWTKDGKGGGGTGQAIRVAQHYSIPVLDFGKFKEVSDMRAAFNQFIKSIDLT